MTFTYQTAVEHPANRDKVRCHGRCRRLTRSYVIQGLHPSADPDATARPLCLYCAVEHRGLDDAGVRL